MPIPSSSILQAVFETADEAILICDQHLKVTHWNTHAEHLLDIQQRELLNLDLVSTFAPKAQNRVREHLNRLLTDAPQTVFSQVSLNRGGSDLTAAASFSTVKEQAQPVLIVSFYDVTKWKETIASLKHSVHHLEELNEMKDHFLDVAAHDLRGPLGRIGLMVDLLTDPRMAEEERNEIQELLRRTSDGLMELVNDLLSVTRIECGRITIQPIATDIPSFLAATLHDHQLIAAQKGIALTRTVDQNLPEVEIDPQRVEQILDHLISNALKFSDSETTITVTARQEGDLIEFSVADQGQGIPKGDQSKIFKAFEMVSSKATGGETSTRLGLAICQKLVELHGGTIDFESTPGKGSRFFFRIPISQKQVRSA